MNDEDDGGGTEIPEWVVTFGDMMSLLLTFFIMLVSLSEIKEEEQYQAMVASVRTQFGYQMTQLNIIPGVATPRNNSIARDSTLGRSKKVDVMRGGNRVKAPVGERIKVQNVRTAKERALDIAVYFDQSYDKLTDTHKEDLQAVAEQIGGKPQKVELRGHTTYAPITEGAGYKDNLELAIHRCRIVKNYLVDELNVDPKRIRISSAGPDEPLYIGTNLQQIAKNQRVEIRMLDEYVDDLRGTEVTENENP